MMLAGGVGWWSTPLARSAMGAGYDPAARKPQGLHKCAIHFVLVGAISTGEAGCSFFLLPSVLAFWSLRRNANG